jgi:ribose transport system permease protein
LITYWLALVGIRTPSLDLALKMPGFRRRMARRIAPDEWLYPNINTGCVVRFDETGRIIETLWDFGGENHPMITSMREHKGHLYIGGILNNRVGRLKLDGMDPAWSGMESYWRRT